MVHDLKRDVKSVTEERHRAATQLQTTLQYIVPPAEQKMKSTATLIAKQFYGKVWGGREGMRVRRECTSGERERRYDYREGGEGEKVWE